MKVSPEVMAVLDGCTLSGNNLALPGQLDRKLYEATNKVLVAAGAKWNRKAQAHVFPGPADDAMEQILLTGEVTIPQDFDYFPTPREIVAHLIGLAYILPHHSALEPSAGRGAIAHPLADICQSVTAVELLPENVKHLLDDRLTVYMSDFLALVPGPGTAFDRIVMNPPFSKQADITHVLHALQFLKPGGRLVSVMGAGVTFRSDRRTVAFRELVEARGGSITPLPPGSFKSSGTGVNTVVAVIPGLPAN